MTDSKGVSRLSPKDQKHLDDLYEMFQTDAINYVGYPCSALFDYTPLFRFLNFPLNNVGDPFRNGTYRLNTHLIEREVLEIFRQLVAAPPDSFWGYITNGGTEGNMYGIFLARELYPRAMVYFSEDTHYSINKTLRLLNIPHAMIKSNDDGAMDLEDLHETLRINRGIPPIICVNIGTTMKGAIDDLKGIKQILKDLSIEQHYLHADAALSGMILPFVEDPQPWNMQDGMDSIAISGHKFVGAPIPCGVVIADRSNVARISRSIEYVGTLDTTIAGSRNAITPLFLWYAFRTVGLKGFRQQVKNSLQTAAYTCQQLNEIGKNAWRHHNSTTVVFDRPSMKIINKWQMAAADEIAHIITMPHITRQLIDRVVEDIAEDTPDASSWSIIP